ncbi:GNAT family N-acetyltransferase [Cryobacterium sp. SO2]|uniref:GNAT family N-acetyltransferase n=1 Tax=Cryobacterium sp. SO2 TaxID=1897060 RepID=UPI00223D21EF|nr:GNAT family N-acetyltransferase [Cryobacterium sp. SO2]WEO76328.1 GNAT family N-acetyltransferase [Cryobacterium sp. SO2]
MPHSSPLVKPWSDLSTDELYAILKLRTDVFFIEQKIDETELDDRDREPGTVHYWLAADGQVTSYLRVLLDTEPEHLDAARVIGRVVVHPDHRGAGLARVLLQRVIDDFGDQAMLLHAQDYIVPLYAHFGFVPFGAPYLEAGINHQSMYRPAGG